MISLVYLFNFCINSEVGVHRSAPGRFFESPVDFDSFSHVIFAIEFFDSLLSLVEAGVLEQGIALNVAGASVQIQYTVFDLAMFTEFVM